MEKKRYTIERLDCANCAAKIEEKINALPGVEATVTFATRTLLVTAENPEALLPRLQRIVSSIEPEAKIVRHVRSRPKAETGSHHHKHGLHLHAQPNGLEQLLLGGGLFLLGVGLDALGAAIFAFRVSSIAYLMAYLLLGAQVLTAAAKSITKGHVFDENFLMGIATIGAILIGEFPEAVGVMLFYRVGEYFEEKAVERSRNQIMEAADLRPETVTLADGSVIPAADAKPGDVLLVRPGDRIGLDGVVVTGISRINTAPITGEAVPVGVRPGDPVTSGCINTVAQLTVRVEKPLEESMVTRILQAVESAAAGKPKIDRFITRFAKVYTPVVVLAALLIAIVPSVVTGNWNYWVYTALSFLVMSCPCALVLSVPLAFFSGIGVGSKRGILFKGGASIEALAKIKAVALDKTGTVTKGEFKVQPCQPELLRLCAACEQYSSHPIAQSIVTAAKEKAMVLAQPESVEELPGHGIRAVLNGKTVLCGNEKLLHRFGVEVPGVQESGSVVLVAADGKYLGCLTVADTVKTGAGRAIEAVKNMGITVAMLTGDTQENAQAVAQAVGIEQVHGRLLPQDKLAVLQQLRKTYGPVMFVGDGINDSPVLAGADVGAAMGSGADAAIEAADVVFMTSSLGAVPTAVRIAQSTRKIAWQNVIFALGIKAIVMTLGLLGFASMWLAVFADSGVAMLCVLNSIRLLYQKKKK